VILLGVVALLIFVAVYFVDNLIEKRDAADASKYATILASQAAETKTLQQQLAEDSAGNAQRDATYQKTIAQLSQGIIQRNAATQQQQKVDANLDAAASAQRISTQTGAAIGEVTVSGNGVVLDLPIARNIVSDLDAFVSTKGDLADTQKQLTTQQGLTADARKEATDAESVVTSQSVQLVDSTKSCNSQIAVVKAAARKSKLKFFGVGFVLGFITGVFAHGV
jgi:hypothetical protein